MIALNIDIIEDQEKFKDQNQDRKWPKLELLACKVFPDYKFV